MQGGFTEILFLVSTVSATCFKNIPGHRLFKHIIVIRGCFFFFFKKGSGTDRNEKQYPAFEWMCERGNRKAFIKSVHYWDDRGALKMDLTLIIYISPLTI